MDNLQLCNAVEEWVNDYSSSYLEMNRELLLEEVSYDIYRGDFIHEKDIKVGRPITITKGLSSWTTSKDVAIEFAQRHAENLEDELGYEEMLKIQEYRYVVYVLEGSKQVIDLMKLSKTLELHDYTIGLINDEEEKILYLEDRVEFIIKETHMMDGVVYTYLGRK